MRQLAIQPRNLLLDVVDRSTGKVCSTIFLALRSQPEEEQACTAANLHHAFWMERTNSLYRAIHPLAHFFGWNRLARVAAVPARDVEGGIIRVRWTLPVG